jgi:hypothetical protein
MLLKYKYLQKHIKMKFVLECTPFKGEARYIPKCFHNCTVTCVSKGVHHLPKLIDFCFWPRRRNAIAINTACETRAIDTHWVLIHHFFCMKNSSIFFYYFHYIYFVKSLHQKTTQRNFIDLSVEGAMTEVTRCGLEVFSKRNILSRLLLNLNICTSTTSYVSLLAGVTSSIF